MQDYNTIIGAIQMRLNKCPTRSVMDRFRIGSSTLNLIMSRYKALELTIDELEAMSPKKVENLFYPQKNLQRKEVPLPDFQYYYDRIHAPNSRVNISFCWLDYKEKNPDGYEKSQFYEYYQRFVQENYGGTKISMAVNRKPGEKMYIDWVGDQPGLLTDVTTGEIMRVHIFATTLGVSSMIYAEAFPNEKLPCFIEGCVHAVSFYGAVAKHFVPDNLKTAVPLYITTDEHMPPEHLYYQEINSKDGNYYRRWASVFGPSMSELIDRILKSSKHEEQAFNACAGILHRVKAIPKGIAEEAARKCIEMNSCRYSTYRQVLKKMECDEHPESSPESLPSHENIRGKDYYK